MNIYAFLDRVEMKPLLVTGNYASHKGLLNGLAKSLDLGELCDWKGRSRIVDVQEVALYSQRFALHVGDPDNVGDIIPLYSRVIVYFADWSVRRRVVKRRSGIEPDFHVYHANLIERQSTIIQACQKSKVSYILRRHLEDVVEDVIQFFTENKRSLGVRLDYM